MINQTSASVVSWPETEHLETTDSSAQHLTDTSENAHAWQAGTDTDTANEQDATGSTVFCNREGKALRVLFVVDSQFPRLGGAENQALKMACALRERSVEVEFVAPRIRKSDPLTDSVMGFKLVRIDYPHIKWVGSIALMAKLYRYLIRHANRFDAVHVHITHIMAAAAGYARRRSSLPVITKISGFYEFEGGVLDQNARYKPLNYLVRSGLRKVDFVQTISEQTREKLLTAGFTPEQIKFVPNGIDTRIPPADMPADGPLTVGYCGRLREVKGVHVLLDAFAIVKSSLPDASIQLAIAGSGDTQQALEEQARRLGIENDIKWLGMVDDTEAFYRSVHIYVQPSFAEGLPNSVMEAMLARRPVIASEIGGNTDLVKHGDSGLLFKAGDANALALRLTELISNPEAGKALSQAGHDLIVERYGFESVTRQLADLYRA